MSITAFKAIVPTGVFQNKGTETLVLILNFFTIVTLFIKTFVRRDFEISNYKLECQLISIQIYDLMLMKHAMPIDMDFLYRYIA